jgi:hypothetical protein
MPAFEIHVWKTIENPIWETEQLIKLKTTKNAEPKHKWFPAQNPKQCWISLGEKKNPAANRM